MSAHITFGYGVWCPCTNPSLHVIKGPIIWPPPAYFILVCASSWRASKGVVGRTPLHALFMRPAPHWFHCCLISAEARYFPTSKSPPPLPQSLLSHRITCSTPPPAEVRSGVRCGGKIRRARVWGPPSNLSNCGINLRRTLLLLFTVTSEPLSPSCQGKGRCRNLWLCALVLCWKYLQYLI